jgi:hypothetical protein
VSSPESEALRELFFALIILAVDFRFALPVSDSSVQERKVQRSRKLPSKANLEFNLGTKELQVGNNADNNRL